jgi:hypothetical protein
VEGISVIVASELMKDTNVIKILRALTITAIVTFLFVPFSIGTPEYSKKENRQCVYCHTGVGKPDLNDAGKFYKEHHTFEGYRDQQKP